MYILVCFDITENKIRYRVVKALKKYGVRVQKSVFECPSLTEAGYMRMRSEVADVLDHEVDTVRYYHLCHGCADRIRLDGTGRILDDTKFKVI
jgi:CRISPR-associated protein Cas2